MSGTIRAIVLLLCAVVLLPLSIGSLIVGDYLFGIVFTAAGLFALRLGWSLLRHPPHKKTR